LILLLFWCSNAFNGTILDLQIDSQTDATFVAEAVRRVTMGFAVELTPGITLTPHSSSMSTSGSTSAVPKLALVARADLPRCPPTDDVVGQFKVFESGNEGNTSSGDTASPESMWVQQMSELEKWEMVCIHSSGGGYMGELGEVLGGLPSNEEIVDAEANGTSRIGSDSAAVSSTATSSTVQATPWQLAQRKCLRALNSCVAHANKLSKPEGSVWAWQPKGSLFLFQAISHGRSSIDIATICSPTAAAKQVSRER
jgi:hypothetical protein